MIDLYYWPTPNGHKITLFLEEAGLAYRVVPVNIGQGDQFKPEFLAIAPNNRMPAIVDHAPSDGGSPISVFESGAILEYLADKVGQFLPKLPRARTQTLQWLYWQMGGVGPMAGQNHHFNHYAPEVIPYAQQRYIKETARLYGVLNKQLSGRDYVAGEYSIADMALFPWVTLWERQGQDISELTNLQAWLARIEKRPATARAYAIAETITEAKPVTELSDADKKRLFNLSQDEDVEQDKSQQNE